MILKLRRFGFLLILLIVLAMAHYTKDLRQHNPETLFLATKEKVEYEDYKIKFNAKQVVVASFVLAANLSEVDIIEFQKIVEDLQLRFSKNIEIIEPGYSLSDSPQSLDYYKRLNKRFLNLALDQRFSLVLIEREHDFNFTEAINYLNEISNKSKFKVEFSGIPFTNYLLDKYSKSIQDVLFPLMFLLSLVLIWFFTRSLVASFLIFLPSIASALIALSVIKAFFGSMNMVSAVIPLICYTINLSLAFHLYCSVQEFGSFGRAVVVKWKPSLLMLVTTAIGFGSLSFSHIAVIREFGYIMMFIIFLTSAFTLFGFFTFENFLGKYRHKEILIGLNRNCIAVTWSKPVIASVFTIFFAAGVVFSFRLSVLTDATEYFPKGPGYKKQMDHIAQQVLGMPILDISIDKTDSEKINAIIVSIVEHLSLSQKYIPISNVTEPEVLNGSDDQSRIVLLGKTINVDEYESDLAKVAEIIAPYSLRPKFNGLYHQLMISQKEMVNTLIISFLSSLIIISVIAFVYLKTFYKLFIFTLINVIPIVAAIAPIYFVGFSLNIASIMTFSIAMGLIVDATFHIMHALEQPEVSFNQLWKVTFLPIIASTLIFVVCFALFGLNDFLPIRQFGIILSIMLLFGGVADLYMLPTLQLGHARIKEFLDAKNL